MEINHIIINFPHFQGQMSFSSSKNNEERICERNLTQYFSFSQLKLRNTTAEKMRVAARAQSSQKQGKGCPFSESKSSKFNGDFLRCYSPPNKCAIFFLSPTTHEKTLDTHQRKCYYFKLNLRAHCKLEQVRSEFQLLLHWPQMASKIGQHEEIRLQSYQAFYSAEKLVYYIFLQNCQSSEMVQKKKILFMLHHFHNKVKSCCFLNIRPTIKGFQGLLSFLEIQLAPQFFFCKLKN